jgi:hypothetical protein
LKTYNPTNFFKHTFCEFTQVIDFKFPENTYYKSKSESFYFYTDEGVYRKSNHWGRVANCRWRLLSDEKIKSQNDYVGFAKWTDFYALNEAEKQFYIAVDFKNKSVDFHHKGTKEDVFLFFAATAQKKAAQIRKLFLNDTWANYFDEDISTLRSQIISIFINSDKTLQEIKRSFK